MYRESGRVEIERQAGGGWRQSLRDIRLGLLQDGEAARNPLVRPNQDPVGMSEQAVVRIVAIERSVRLRRRFSSLSGNVELKEQQIEVRRTRRRQRETFRR